MPEVPFPVPKPDFVLVNSNYLFFPSSSIEESDRMAIESIRMTEGQAEERMAEFLGPGYVDEMIRQAIQCC